MGSNAPGESENARAKLIELLERLRLTWNDLPGLLATPDDATAPDGDDHNHQSPTWERATDVGEGGPRPEAGEIVGDVLAVLSRYVGLTDHCRCVVDRPDVDFSPVLGHSAPGAHQPYSPMRQDNTPRAACKDLPESGEA
jgi:hypothetical protein